MKQGILVLGLAMLIAACGTSSSPVPTQLPADKVALPSSPASSVLEPSTAEPTAPPPAAKMVLPVAAVSYLSTDKAYVRRTSDGQADVWVRFTNTTKQTMGYFTVVAQLFSGVVPVGTEFDLSSDPFLILFANGHGWLHGRAPATDFDKVNAVGMREGAAPSLDTFKRLLPFRVSKVIATRALDGSVELSGVIDGVTSPFGAFITVVVLDTGGAPLGEVDVFMKAPAHFSSTPFSGQSTTVLPGDIGGVDVHTE